MGRIFDFPYRTVAEISLQALIRNLTNLRLFCGLDVIPVVKADAYGHGVIPISKVLLNRGSCQMLAVATLEEAIALRKQFSSRFSILVLSGFLPHQINAYVRFNVIPVVHTMPHLRSLIGVAQLPPIHLKYDSGMNRLGVKREEMPEVMQLLRKMSIKLSGFATHFAESDDPISKFVDEQIADFEYWYRELRSRGLMHTDAKVHLANSGGTLRRKLSVANAIRPGLSLYGVSPNPALNTGVSLLPVLQWKTRILCLKRMVAGETTGYGRTYMAKKDELLGIIPVGYADGYPRLLGNIGEVIVFGKRAAIRGRISMDLTAVDLTDIPEAKEGSLVTLLGSNGDEEITSWEIARWAQTIPYEIFCGLSNRVARIYIDSEAT